MPWPQTTDHRPHLCATRDKLKTDETPQRKLVVSHAIGAPKRLREKGREVTNRLEF